MAEFLNKNFLFGGGIGTGAENLHSLKTNANTNKKINPKYICTPCKYQVQCIRKKKSYKYFAAFLIFDIFVNCNWVATRWQ